MAGPRSTPQKTFRSASIVQKGGRSDGFGGFGGFGGSGARACLAVTTAVARLGVTIGSG